MSVETTVDKGVLLAEVKVGYGVDKLLLSGDFVLRQKIYDLLNRIALWNREKHQALLSPATSIGVVHIIHQAAIVHRGIQLVGAGVDVFLCAGENFIQNEKSLQLDQPRLFQLRGDLKNAVALLDGHGVGVVALVQGAEVIGQYPAQACQQHRPQDHRRNINLPVEFAVFFLFGAGLSACIHLAYDPAAHRLGIPALCIGPLILTHDCLSFLYFLRNISRTSYTFPHSRIECTIR